MSVTVLHGLALHRYVVDERARVLGDGDTSCTVVFGEEKIGIVFRLGVAARQMTELVCQHLELVNVEAFGLFVEEERELDLDELVVARSRLVLRKRASNAFRGCVLNSDGLCWRGWLSWQMRPVEILSLCGCDRGMALALSSSGQSLEPDVPLEQQLAADMQSRHVGDVLLLIARSEKPVCAAALSAPLRGWILMGQDARKQVMLAAVSDATGHDLLRAMRPDGGAEEWSLLQAGTPVNLDERLQWTDDRLQIRGAQEEQQAVMQAAAAAFAEAAQYNLLRGETVVHKIQNVFHWVRRVGKVLGTLLLTRYRIVFVAHDRSTFVAFLFFFFFF